MYYFEKSPLAKKCRRQIESYPIGTEDGSCWMPSL